MGLQLGVTGHAVATVVLPTPAASDEDDESADHKDATSDDE
jgi:hypothetical protein